MKIANGDSRLVWIVAAALVGYLGSSVQNATINVVRIDHLVEAVEKIGDKLDAVIETDQNQTLRIAALEHENDFLGRAGSATDERTLNREIGDELAKLSDRLDDVKFLLMESDLVTGGLRGEGGPGPLEEEDAG